MMTLPGQVLILLGGQSQPSGQGGGLTLLVLQGHLDTTTKYTWALQQQHVLSNQQNFMEIVKRKKIKIGQG